MKRVNCYAGLGTISLRLYRGHQGYYYCVCRRSNVCTTFSAPIHSLKIDPLSDFAEFLGRSYTLLTSMNINTSLPDSNRFRVELRSSIGNQFGLPHQYKNFEFSGWKAPIILFSCPVASEPLQDDSPAACAVHAFYVLAEHTHSLSTPPRNGESEELLRKVRKLWAH